MWLLARELARTPATFLGSLPVYTRQVCTYAYYSGAAQVCYTVWYARALVICIGRWALPVKVMARELTGMCAPVEARMLRTP